jgi:5-methylcytosine-specific restriction endonuclease McrA
MQYNKNVLVLDVWYQPVTLTSVRKAITLLWLDKVELIEHSDYLMHSPSRTLNRPLIIRLKEKLKSNSWKRVQLNRRNLFKRDDHRCVYCGSNENLTVDHVVPRCYGGKTTWDNVVTACHTCNNKKDNKSPEEVGLKLRVKPKQPNHLLFMAHKTKLHEKWKPYLYMS